MTVRSLASRGHVLLRYAGAFAIVAAASVVADVFSRLTGTSRLTSIFLSSVLLAAFYLGSGPGYAAAALAMVAHLYLVDPPYEFSLGSIEEMNALLLFTAASILVCLLAGRMREERRTAMMRTRMNTALLDATREFADTSDEALIRQRLAERLLEVSEGAAIVLTDHHAIAVPADGLTPDDHRDAGAALAAATSGQTDTQSQGNWRFRAIMAGEQGFGIAGWRARPGRRLRREEAAALELLTDTGAAAIARARLATEKANAESRARTEELRNALLSSISHDLRTPLAAILASASSLQEFAEAFDADTRRDLATTIKEEAERLDLFVANLLNMSRLEADALTLQRVAFSVPEVVARAAARRGRGRGAPISVPAALPEAFGDPLLFEQAIGNVLENASRYTPEGSAIDIVASRNGDLIEVRVRDEGSGLADTDLKKVFEKFYRAPTSLEKSGTGLGLSIARGLIQAMGGDVWAANRRDRTGLEVTLSVPVAS